MIDPFTGLMMRWIEAGAFVLMAIADAYPSSFAK